MANDYLENLVRELEESGVKPTSVTDSTSYSVQDNDLKLILDMERDTGVKYSDEQKKILSHRGNMCILACAGSGKALVNGTCVLTPTGYRQIEDLKIFDMVYDYTGNKQYVMGVYHQGKKQVYQVHFNDGTVIECCKDHLWKYKSNGSRHYTVGTTSEMYSKQIKGISLEIPLCKPIKFDKSRLGLKSYALGLILGKCSCDIDEENKLRELNKLESLSISEKNLKIPEEYKFSTVSDRVDILNGIIDSKNPKVESLGDFCGYKLGFNSKQLCEDVKFISQTLGLLVKSDENEEDNIYSLYLKQPDTIKILNIKSSSKELISNRKVITDIVKTSEYKEMTCIEISGSSKLYITDNCTVTHNTTVSTHLIAKRILTGEIADVNKMIYTTYSKAGATEMKERLDKLLGVLGISRNVQVRTIHSFFLQILRTFGVNADIISEKDRAKFIKEAAKDSEFTLKDDDFSILDNLLSYQVNNLLSDKKTVNSSVNSLEDLEVETYSKIRLGYANRKAKAGLIDYDDMQSYLYLWLVKFSKSENPSDVNTAFQVRNYCRAMWTDFYIDEAQDVSKIQFEIIRAMITEPDKPDKLLSNLVFIGDDDQCIYQWRGSDPSIILGIGPLFDMQTFVLSTNYRCREKILRYASKGIEYNDVRYKKDMKSFKPDGSVKIAKANTYSLYDLSLVAMEQIKRWISSGVKLSDIAVLSRNNFHLAILSNMLMRDGVYSHMTEDMKLTKSYMYKDVKAIMELAETNWKKELTAQTLWKLCHYMSISNARVIATFQDTCSLSFEDTLEYILTGYFNYTPEKKMSKKLGITMQADEKLRYYMRKISNSCVNDMIKVYEWVKLEDKKLAIQCLLYQYLDVCSYLYKSRDKNRSITGLVKYINSLITEMGLEQTKQFLRVTEQFENGRMGIIGDRVTLTTMHSAKGREWSNVIMFGCDSITQPSIEGISNMVLNDLKISDIHKYINEERRLFYVGNTRAKDNLLVITNDCPSPFLLEALEIIPSNPRYNNDIYLEFASDAYRLDEFNSRLFELIEDKDSEYFYEKDSDK